MLICVWSRSVFLHFHMDLKNALVSKRHICHLNLTISTDQKNCQEDKYRIHIVYFVFKILGWLGISNSIDPSKKQITMTLDNCLHKKCICEAQIIYNFKILNMFLCSFLKSYKSFIMKQLLKMTYRVNVKSISVNYLQFFTQDSVH